MDDNSSGTHAARGCDAHFVLGVLREEGAYSPLPSGPQTSVNPPLNAAVEDERRQFLRTAARVPRRSAWARRGWRQNHSS